MDKIIELLKKAWSFIKKVAVRLFSFIKNIVNFFKVKILIALKRTPNVKAISLRIKEDLKKGNFKTLDIGLEKEQVVNTFYDVDKEEIMTDLTQVISANQLDQETINNFGEKEMLILS
ncbi:hypothetical protein [Gimesia chilikensis]|uniref:hypothetical protein n=1 Tax=Gimesia chilikensis TaxID=2605989 RepID=UPI003A955EEC